MQLQVLHGMPSESSARTTSASWASPPESRTAAPFGDEVTDSPKRASTLFMRSSSSGSAGMTSTLGRPISALSASGVPSATILPLVDDRDAVRQLVGLLEVLGGEEDRDAVVAREPLDLLPQRAAALRVETGRGLVEEEDPRPVHERERQVEPPLHAARVAAHLAVGRVRVRPTRSSSAAPRAARSAPRQAVERGLELHVLGAGEERVERGLLERRPDRGAHPGSLVDHVVAGHARAARRGRQQRGEHVDGRGLAGAVGAQEAEDLAGRDLDVDAVNRARALLELADEVGGLDGG